ncbi:MAG TPA: pentapeptide repeat-containing protein [Syntrophorhabdaceae bacterium]|nr:pentapeptide repeat-containing protein [Syntrophorhabdaceae bacterium]
MIDDESYTIEPNTLKASKPVSVWNRNVQITSKDLFRAIGKVTIKGISLNFEGIAETALDTLKEAGLQSTAKEIVWLLISRSLNSAISKLRHDYGDLFENPPDKKGQEIIFSSFENEMEQIEVTIDLVFFQKPAELKLLKDLMAPLARLMEGLGASEYNAIKVSSHLPDYFETALNETWRASPQDYVKLKDFFDTPFTNATEETRGWQLYVQWLKKQVNDRMFAEAFGVEEVYIPLRAYYEERRDNDDKNLDPFGRENRVRKVVFDLETDIMDWLKNFSTNTAVRFISGGPGSGKSTFAKVLAKHVTDEMNIPTLYIPLHLFNLTDSLISAMKDYIKGNRFLSGNPLEGKHGKQRLFIIFDGLDELALQGKVASEAANAFVDEVLRRIHYGNVQGFQRQALITGRTIAIQSVANKLREPKQISYVLPYLVNYRNEYDDPKGLLLEDQRNPWWVLYGKATDKAYSSMPDDLKRESLEEITAQPLLNYLVALSYNQKRIEFTDDTTLNQIYADLIGEVYRRHYERSRTNVHVGLLTETEFLRVLEEIAIAIWHGEGLTAPISRIREKCKSAGIQIYLDSMEEGEEAGVTRLLTAFYFRRSESRIDGDPTFEFTHKSFGEYLAARRILRLLLQILKETKRRKVDSDEGWSTEEALERWTELCSPKGLDFDLLRFIDNGLREVKHEDLLQLQNIVRDLLYYAISKGLPFPKTYANKDFKLQLRLARNAEEALLGVHFSIARSTKQISELKFESPTDFGEWIARLRGQRQGPQNKLALSSLGFLDLSKSFLEMQDFFNTNFKRTNFREANLEEANLGRADLEGADLAWAKLSRAILRRSNLEEANLEEANLREVDLRGADLRGANLRRANLEEANIKEANLGRADLREADLRGADLRGANLEEANIKEANLGRADLREANLRGADLRGANLRGADLSGATNLKKAHFKEAHFEGAIIEETDLKYALSQGAHLR